MDRQRGLSGVQAAPPGRPVPAYARCPHMSVTGAVAAVACGACGPLPINRTG